MLTTNQKIKNNFKNYYRIVTLFLIIIIFILIIYFYSIATNTKNLTVRFLDIGQGDAILIKTPNKETLLIDAGRDAKVLSKLEKYQSIFNKNIDLIIPTHPDADHIAGFLSILPKYNVKNILENGDMTQDTEVSKNFNSLASKELNGNTPRIANCGDKINFATDIPLNLYIIHPVKNNIVINDTNDNSIVALLTYGKYSFLFTGDATKEIEKKIFFDVENCFNQKDSEIIETYLKNLTVLKVSHHGSNTGTAVEFLKVIKPEYSIISAGKDNSYGHPKKEVLEILEKYSKHTLSTILNGDISFITNGEDLTLELEKTN